MLCSSLLCFIYSKKFPYGFGYVHFLFRDALLAIEFIAFSLLILLLLNRILLLLYVFCSVYKQIMSMKAVANISSFSAQFKTDVSLDLAFNFLWDFYWKTISSPACDSEVLCKLIGSFSL